MTEVQVWEHVLKWGFAQNPGLSSDPSYYSNDDFNALKNTLQQCIPFMKFFDLTPREFLKNVFPYRKILPNELYVELLKLFLDNDYRPSTKKIVDSKNQHPTKKIVDSKIIKNQYPYKKIKYFDNPNNKSEPQLAKSSKNIDSIIITIQHAELISKWIDRLENTDELKNSYKFKLILRGSRDGFTAERFHEICDDQSNTVTIIKVKDTNEILGGYNPIKWKSDNGYGITDDSFIFSFDKTRVESYILSRVKNENYAINYWHHYGPSFGGGDLIIYEGREGEVSFSNKTSYCYYEDSYEKQIRKTKEYFSVEEYEVFQIINNN
ncbi:carbohydrate-binding module family 13 protein [Rhizophagus irregularis DAOM 181602=DAOM 197198]|nr:carbohydrate-binding module family 13 protein [Rhizophagus irregularis DAOM 181602=DAOM 197198]